MVTTFSTEEAKIIGHSLSMDWEHFDIEEFRMGLDIEREEHGSYDEQTDLTHNNPLLIGKIVLAHLQKLPDYYSRLAKMEADAAEFSPEIDRLINKPIEDTYDLKQAETWTDLDTESRYRIRNLTSRIHNLERLQCRVENGGAQKLEMQAQVLQAEREMVYEKKRETLQAQQQAIKDSIKALALQESLTVMKVRDKFKAQVNELERELEATKAQWQADVGTQLIIWHAEITRLQASWERAKLTQADAAFSADQVERLQYLQGQWPKLYRALEDGISADISTWMAEVGDLKAQCTGCDTWEEFELSQRINTLLDKKRQAETKLQTLREMAPNVSDLPKPKPDNRGQPEWLGFKPITFH